MHDPALKEEMEEFYRYLQYILCDEDITIPSNNYDLVLDITPTPPDDGRIQWSYYYACHESRCLFWFDECHANHMLSEVFWVTSPAHVSESQISSSISSPYPLIWCAEHRLEALYWYLFLPKC